MVSDERVRWPNRHIFLLLVYFLYIFYAIFGSLIMPEKVATLKKQNE